MASEDPADRLANLSTMPGMPGDWRDTMRAVVAELKHMREYVAALNEAQVGLQSSAFKAGWWACRDSVVSNVSIPLAELHTLNYANEVRALNDDRCGHCGMPTTQDFAEQVGAKRTCRNCRERQRAESDANPQQTERNGGGS